MEHGEIKLAAGSWKNSEVRDQMSEVRRQTTELGIVDFGLGIVDLGCEMRNTLNRLRLSACPEPVEGLTAHSSFERLGRFERV